MGSGPPPRRDQGEGGCGNPGGGYGHSLTNAGGREPLAGGTPVVAFHWFEYRAPVSAGRLVCVALVCETLLSLSPLTTLAKHKTAKNKLQNQTVQSQTKKVGQYKHQTTDSDLRVGDQGHLGPRPLSRAPLSLGTPDRKPQLKPEQEH